LFIPDDPYARSKYEAEQKLLAMADTNNFEVVIIRPPLVYGPGVKANFSNMVKWTIKGIPLPLGAINNKRSLIALENLIDFISICINHKNAANEIFMVSDDDDMSITELLKAIANAFEKPSRLIHIPESFLRLAAMIVGKRNISRRLLDSLQVDISKAKRKLDWRPPLSTKVALRNMAKEYKP